MVHASTELCLAPEADHHVVKDCRHQGIDCFKCVISLRVYISRFLISLRWTALGATISNYHHCSTQSGGGGWRRPIGQLIVLYLVTVCHEMMDHMSVWWIVTFQQLWLFHHHYNCYLSCIKLHIFILETVTWLRVVHLLAETGKF